MAITTDKNTTYGPPLVAQKYTPLRNPVFDDADRPVCTGLLNNRMRMLRAVGLIGQQLELTVPNWAATIAAENAHLPPLVVVSSNRAAWIRCGINAGITQRANLGIAAYNSASDLRALTDEDGNLGISPPLYAPSRIGTNRNVYVVVNIAEYTVYKAKLAGTGITPVGWNFAKGVSAQRNLRMTGFGATRFAAMEFCKTLRQLAAAAAGGVAPWNSAWIIDDNTVALSNFAGFAAAEAALGANACAGFHGATLAETPAANKDWALNQIARGFGQQAPLLPPSVPPGLVQQVALWNIDYFYRNHLNFGPLFITSAEDKSITNYFNNRGIPYQFYDGTHVCKENPTYDNGGSAAKLNKNRQDLARWITTAESATPPAGAPPPPIQVQPRDPADGGVQTLSNFITTRVLPNALEAVAAQATNANSQAQAKSQGVEQLISDALNARFVTPGAITGTFQINGANQQVVQRRDRP
jgi:hypothetical protein